MNTNMHNCNTLTSGLMFLRHNYQDRSCLVSFTNAWYHLLSICIVSIQILTQCEKEKKTGYLNVSFLHHILHLLDLWPSRDLETQTDPLASIINLFLVTQGIMLAFVLNIN